MMEFWRPGAEDDGEGGVSIELGEVGMEFMACEWLV